MAMSRSEQWWRQRQELLKRSILRSRTEKNLMAMQFKRAERAVKEYQGPEKPKGKKVGRSEANPLPKVYQGPINRNAANRVYKGKGLKAKNRQSIANTPTGAYKRFAKMGAYVPKSMTALLGRRGGAFSKGGSMASRMAGRFRTGYRDIR